MWFWLVSAIAGSILGNATDSWFSQTKFGVWFYKKLDDVCTWAAGKLNIKVLSEEAAWEKKHPNIAKRIKKLEGKINELKSRN